ncbi:ABC transporter permease [Siculibacillus lacustris]|uniref:ABC transporter permease n=1 Tax=Siculibacillus lacustris TaxID=1549641 RepID=A0A4V6MZ32_9HYPH|nr:ABC transporter permease [Siculibacillus lacustris]TBW38258.1 ABC transporter permease [Siculibacillus lacustris]
MRRLLPVVTALAAGLARALAIVAVAFFLCRVMPGDVVDVLGLEGGLTDAQQAELRAALGLDRPVIAQFVDWGAQALGGDFGRSVRFDRPVAEMLVHAAPVTLELALGSFGVGIGLAFGLAIAATSLRSRVLDAVIDALNVWSIAVPTFCAGVVGIIVFSLWLGWLPVIGSLVLPILIIGLDNAGQIVKLVREDLAEAVMLPHVRTARAKGLSPWRIALVHVLPVAAPIALVLSGLVLSGLVAGTLTMEILFGLPGIGSLMLNAVHGRDLPVVLAAVTVVAVALVAINTLVDALHRLIDPRVTR